MKDETQIRIGKRIRERREELQITQEELAIRIGYKTRASINKIETGDRNLAQSKIKAIADALSTTPSYIMGWDEKPKQLHQKIRVLGSVPAGIPVEAIEDVVDWEDISYTDAEYIGLKVKGDSMFPKYIEGDTVIVRIQPDCESGQDAVVYVNGYEATLKKVIKRDDATILQPLNPNYEPIFLKKKDGIKVLGVIVELRRKI